MRHRTCARLTLEIFFLTRRLNLISYQWSHKLFNIFKFQVTLHSLHSMDNSLFHRLSVASYWYWSDLIASVLFLVWSPKNEQNFWRITAFLFTVIFVVELSISVSQRHRPIRCGEPIKYPGKQLGDKYRQKVEFSDGEKVVYTCVLGYTQSAGSRTSQCVQGRWTTLNMNCQSKMHLFIYL